MFTRALGLLSDGYEYAISAAIFERNDGLAEVATQCFPFSIESATNRNVNNTYLSDSLINQSNCEVRFVRA